MSSIYNTKPNGKGLPKKEEHQTGTSLYNKMMEGYVPVPRSEKAPYSMSKMGSVVEITLGDQKVIVHDPARLEGIINLVEKHENSLYTIRQNIKNLNLIIKNNAAEIKSLKEEIQKLKDKLGGNNSYL